MLHINLLRKKADGNQALRPHQAGIKRKERFLSLLLLDRKLHQLPKSKFKLNLKFRLSLKKTERQNTQEYLEKVFLKSSILPTSFNSSVISLEYKNGDNLKMLKEKVLLISTVLQNSMLKC